MAWFEVLAANLRAIGCLFARASGSGEVKEEPGLTLASAGVEFATFNAALLAAPVPGRRELLEQVIRAGRFFDSRGLPWSFWVCEGWLAGSARRDRDEVFRKAGMRLVAEMPGMAAVGIAPPPCCLPRLEVRSAAEEPARSHFCEIIAASFDVPIAISRLIYGSDALWEGGLEGWVGYADSQAVTTAATLNAGGAVGLYAVGTLPGYRRRGYAEAVVRHALARAQESSGVAANVLESTRAGFSLYQRLGYKIVTRYTLYAAQRG